jgi:UDP-glucose 4-epimerase
MKYLITGGAGFIGSHLCDELLKSGRDSVFVIDDLSTGSIRNIIHHKDNPRFKYTIDTIMNKPVLAELIDQADIIFHLAASVGVRLIIESPVSTIETNIKGTENVLELAAKKRKKVIIASTSEVYGKSNKEMFSENDDLVLGPTYKSRWSYAGSKIVDEFLALAYWKEKKLPVVIVRLFNTVGPRQTGRYGMVLPTFVSQALNGEPITVYSDGKQVRCFTHVSDVVGALVKLAIHPEAVGGIFNIGNSEQTTILDLAKLVIATAKSKSKIEFIPYSEAYEEGFEDMLRRSPDISKVKKLIGYKPLHSLKDIIKSIIEYQRKNEQAHI